MKRFLTPKPASNHPMSSVCANCFQNKIARQFIRQNGTTGDCDFCDSKNRKVLPARRMKGLFELLSLYRPYEPAPGVEFWRGDTLSECLAEYGDENRQNAILRQKIGSRNPIIGRQIHCTRDGLGLLNISSAIADL